MTDDERFSLLISLLGNVQGGTFPPDPRLPTGINMSTLEHYTGAVNPSGRLPITFPADLAQTPRRELPGLGTPWDTPVTIRYDEGAEVGYRWYAQKHRTPMYPFGHGLSYTTFESTATFTVTGARRAIRGEDRAFFSVATVGSPASRARWRAMRAGRPLGR